MADPLKRSGAVAQLEAAGGAREADDDQTVHQAKKSCKKADPPPVLLAVTVIPNAANAVNTGGKAWEAIYHAANDVLVQATTYPNNNLAEWNQIVWTNGNLGPQPNQRLVPCNALVQALRVTAALGGVTDHVDITVLPVLVSITVTANALNTAGKVWKAFLDGGGPAVLVQATTAPNDNAAEWAQITWTNGAAVMGQANQREVARNAAGVVRVTAALGGVNDYVDVNICQPPVLAIDSITFTGHRVVEQDTLGNFAAPEWQAAPLTNHPVAYNRNTAVQLTPTFRVTTQPTEAEQVAVTGTCTFGATLLTWTGNVTVNPGDVTVVTGAALTSDVALPNVVGCYDPATIAWTATPLNGAVAPAGNSAHTMYAPLGASTGGPDYWTLLDVSCRAAAGQNAANAVVAAIFGPFAGFNVPRKRDGTQLTYWVPNNTTAQTTAQLLARPDGGGQCGAWAELLRDMCQAHGIATVNKVTVDVPQPFVPYRYGFLVKNWTFHAPPAATANTWTHLQDLNRIMGATPGWCNTRPPYGIAGQANANPPPSFFNHFIVINTATGILYDPSYGATAASRLLWEAAAVDGLFDNGMVPLAGLSTAAGAANLVRFTNQATGANIV